VSLDYLYTPSKNVAADLEYFTKVLGADVGFAIDGMGARVALVRMTDGPPHVLHRSSRGRAPDLHLGLAT
jgi:hypothetical protein